MPRIEFTKPFPIAEDGMHVVTWPIGDHDVSDLCARIAIENGFAKERPSGGQTGPVKQSSSPQPGRAKNGATLKKPKANRK